jgi:hypothetical protein
LPALSARPHSDAQDIALPAEHRVLTGTRRNPDFHAYHERRFDSLPKRPGLLIS